MPRVMELKDKKCETIFDERDFKELVEKYMGYEAARFFEETIDKLDELSAEIERLEGELTRLQEELKELE